MMSTKRAALVVLGLVAGLADCTCEGGTVSTLIPRAEVAPDVLDLGTTPVGVRVQGVLTLRSVGTAVLDVSGIALTGPAFFRIEGDPPPGPQAVAPSGSVPIVIAARPDVVGDFEAVLTVDHDGAETALTQVKVRLKAVPPPPCDDGNACTTDTFDTDSASCLHAFADGIPCQAADRCVIDAICQQGVCLGAQKTCHDESVCTRDVCRQVDGECRFIEDARACDDDNPCTVDTCGAGGCAHAPQPNGAACDDGDACTSGDACFAGACVGTGAGDGELCDDGDSCTTGDTCLSGRCTGTSIIAGPEGARIFEFPLAQWTGAFVHRREVSMRDDGIFVGMDHLPLVDPPGLSHVVFAMKQCGTPAYQFSYRPPDGHVFVSYVRREMQLDPEGGLRIVVGIRQTRDQGFQPETTSYLLDPMGVPTRSIIQVPGGETGRSLLPDGSHIYGTVWPLQSGPVGPDEQAMTNIVVVREDSFGNVLWQHERTSGDWAEFLGTAGPRVLFWASESWGALDFNTGSLVWSSRTPFIADQMALSTNLNLGLTRVGSVNDFGFSVPAQLVGVEILQGRQVFVFPPVQDVGYIPRTDPVIAADGRIILLMQKGVMDERGHYSPSGLDFVELAADGSVLTTTPLPYAFPAGFIPTRSRDIGDDPFPTVADDGVTYVGYGDQFWAINPGGQIRWTYTSTMPDAFTATVPLLREDGVVLINEGSRKIIGLRTNGGRMSEEGWASFRHDGRRTNYTP